MYSLANYPLKYGVIKLNTEAILSDNIGHVKLIFRSIGKGTYQYVREIGESEIENTLITSDNEVGIYPTTPNIIYPEYSEFVYVRFSNEVIIESGGETEFFIKAPVGIVLTLENEEIFDGFTLNEKHALYGSLVKGVLARYFVSKIHFEKPSNIAFGEAVVKVKIANVFDEVANVSKIVFPTTGVPLYYSVDGYEAFYANVIMKVIDRGIAEITVLDEKPFDNLKESPVKIGSPKKSFVMEWGI